MAAEEVMADVHRYMASHPESELHRRGKMFGVLVVRKENGEAGYLRAFSAMLDGTYHHTGYVEPVVDIAQPEGYFKQEEMRISAMPQGMERKACSQALQRWLFAEYKMLNRSREERNLLSIFAEEKPILSAEDYFSERRQELLRQPTMPPSGAGECCAPKLLQYAFANGLTPLCMAEFWIGASSKEELRTEGCYYPACLEKCRPILRHMLQGLATDDNPMTADARHLAERVEVLYEDDYLLAVNKPSGLLSVPGRETAYSLQEWGAEHCGGLTPQAVHRLDQDTSGIVVMAKTETCYTMMQRLFQRRDILKRYEAVLTREPAEKEGIINLPLLPNPADRPRQRVDYEHGKPAVTRYRLRGMVETGALVDFFPETGRTHQLRVHAAHPDGLDAPIVGDRLYGTPAERLMLHAAELQFAHPITGQPIHLCCPLF